MSTKERESKIYLARNKDGYLCAYNKETKICEGVLIGTGEELLSEEKMKAIIGTIDPKAKAKE